MLLILLFWTWAVAVGLGLGLGLARGLEIIWGRLPRLLTSSPELLIVGGLAVLAWLVAVLSFGLPVALPMQLGLSAVAGAFLLTNRARLRVLLRDYGRGWWNAGAGAALLAAVLTLLLLVHAAQPPIFPDSALYHAQFIQWMHYYPVVPGLGNLQSKLSFNSHADLLTAFFSPAGMPGHEPAFQQIVSSLGFLLLALHHVRRAGALLRMGPQPWLASFYLISTVLLLLVLRPWISSPLPDNTAAVLGLLLLSILIEPPQLPLAGLGWLAVLAAMTVTVKASMGLVLLWPLVAAWGQPAQRRGQRVVLLLGVELVGLLPWLGRNVGLSGYLVYPLTGQLGPLVRDWAVLPTMLAADLTELRLFARRPLGDWSSVANQSLRQWLPSWWTQQEPADKLLLLMVVVGSGLLAGWLGWQLLVKKTSFTVLARQSNLWLYALLLPSCGGWFVVAPALRYAYAYLIGAATLAPLLIARTLPVRWGRACGWLLGVLTLAYALNGLRHELAKPGALTTYLVRPADYPMVRTRIAGYLGPYPVRTGAWPNSRCGNSPLPCTDSLAPRLQLRGPTLRQGFRWVALPE